MRVRDVSASTASVLLVTGSLVLNLPYLTGATRFVPALLGAGLGLYACLQFSNFRQGSQPPPPQPHETQFVERLAQLDEDSHNFSATGDQLVTFAFLLLFPEMNRSRVKETIDMREELLTKRSCTEISLEISPSRERHGANFLYVPVMRPLKKRLLTDFSVSDGGDAPLLTLNHEESLLFLIKVARNLIRDAYGIGEDETLWTKEQGATFALVLELLLQVPNVPLSTRLDRVRERERASARLNAVAKNLTETGGSEELKAFVELVATNYVIIARVPKAKRFQVKYSYRMDRLPLPAARKGMWWLRAKGHLRVATGSDAANLELAVSKPKSCTSYHLNIQMPPGTYVADQVLTDADGEPVPKIDQGGYNRGDPYFRLAGRGRTRAHFYSRALRQSHDASLLRLKVQEKPPGSLGRALLCAAVTLILVWAVAPPRPPHAVDGAAALAAGIPYVVAVFGFVRGVGKSRSRVFAIMSGWSALITSIIALCAMTLLLLGYTDSPESNNVVRFVDVTHPAWVCLCAMAFANVVSVTGLLITRWRRFVKASERQTEPLDLDGFRALSSRLPSVREGDRK